MELKGENKRATGMCLEGKRGGKVGTCLRERERKERREPAGKHFVMCSGWTIKICFKNQIASEIFDIRY